MKSTQNKKIEQVKESTMIVGIDVGSEKHYFRAFNWRGIELTRKPIPFSNSMAGFDMFHSAVVELMEIWRRLLWVLSRQGITGLILVSF